MTILYTELPKPLQSESWDCRCEEADEEARGEGSRLAIKWGVGVSQAARQLREYTYMTKHVEPSRPVIDSMQLKSLCLSKSFSRGIVSSVLSRITICVHRYFLRRLVMSSQILCTSRTYDFVVADISFLK